MTRKPSDLGAGGRWGRDRISLSDAMEIGEPVFGPDTRDQLIGAIQDGKVKAWYLDETGKQRRLEPSEAPAAEIDPEANNIRPKSDVINLVIDCGDEANALGSDDLADLTKMPKPGGAIIRNANWREHLRLFNDDEAAPAELRSRKGVGGRRAKYDWRLVERQIFLSIHVDGHPPTIKALAERAWFRCQRVHGWTTEEMPERSAMAARCSEILKAVEGALDDGPLPETLVDMSPADEPLVED